MPDYPIRAVSKLTGLSVDTLRAWERRYRAIVPRRNNRGRLYSDQDIQRLSLLRQAVEGGHAIGQLAKLKDQDLSALLEAPLSRPGSAAIQHEGRTKESKGEELESLLNAVRHFDYSRADGELGRLAVLLPPRQLVHDIVLPLLQQIGQSWVSGKFSIAQEHMVSGILRGLLGALTRLHSPVSSSSTLLFATLSDDLHEFGILSAALLSAGGGLGVVYLGPNLPPQEIAEAAKRVRARIVVLGAALMGERNHLLKQVKQVVRGLAGAAEVWVGGRLTEALKRDLEAVGALPLADFHVFEQHLLRLGARF